MLPALLSNSQNSGVLSTPLIGASAEHSTVRAAVGKGAPAQPGPMELYCTAETSMSKEVAGRTSQRQDPRAP